jgi:hypothetical protein
MHIEYVYALPNKNTCDIKPIREFIKREIPKAGLTIDPFARKQTFCKVTNDLNPEYKTTYNLKSIDFLKTFEDESVDFIIYDPPFTPRQVKECYDSIGIECMQDDTRTTFWSRDKDEIARIIKPGGKVVSLGFNSVGMGKSRGFIKQKILIVCHGGNHNDTICTLEIKSHEKQLSLIS